MDVQVQISAAFVGFTIAGLPDKAVGESREPVRAALHSLGLALPPKRITVNLAPADLLKEAHISGHNRSSIRNRGAGDGALKPTVSFA